MEPKDRSALDDARRLLAECSLFRGLSPDERNVLVARAHLRLPGLFFLPFPLEPLPLPPPLPQLLALHA